MKITQSWLRHREFLQKRLGDSMDFFIQLIRRGIFTLERPLVTAREEGKSYIYSNFNPEYAQYALTILRVNFNFCMPYTSIDGEKLTPAQD